MASNRSFETTVAAAVTLAVAIWALPAAAQSRNDAYRPTDTGPGLGTLDQSTSYPPPSGPAPADRGYSNPYSRDQGGTATSGGYVPKYSDPVRPYGSDQAPQQTQSQYPPPQGGGTGSSYGAGPSDNSGGGSYRPWQNNGASGQDSYGRTADDRYDDRRSDDRRYDDRPRDDRPPPPPYDDRGPRDDGTYSSNDVITAGGNFFGAASQGLAKIVENLFKSQGRPNGYILGDEGGGAFIAGLRYGHGTLYTRDAGSRPVYWEGPSIGYDFGGAGSKVMVLVYNLHSVDEVYDRFGGVDGSAYFVGGLGVTLLKHNHVTLAPIRTGVGLRLGANIGYLKFTPRATVNPF